MDSILKARYDSYRADGTFPPEVLELTKDGIKPFQDLPQLNEWRENTRALAIVDERGGYMLVGKIDDVLVESDGRFIPADYKSSGNAPAEDKQKYYRDQLAAYGLMFHKQGFPVSNRAYLLHYFVRDKNDPSIEVKFQSHMDRVAIDVAAIEKKLADMVVLLNGSYPGYNSACETCVFSKGREDALR